MSKLNFAIKQIPCFHIVKSCINFYLIKLPHSEPGVRLYFCTAVYRAEIMLCLLLTRCSGCNIKDTHPELTVSYLIVLGYYFLITGLS